MVQGDGGIAHGGEGRRQGEGGAVQRRVVGRGAVTGQLRMQWEKKRAGRRGVHLVEKNMCAVKIISREKEKELGKKRRRDKIEGYYRHSIFFNDQEKLFYQTFFSTALQ